MTIHVRCDRCGADYPELDEEFFGIPIQGSRCNLIVQHTLGGWVRPCNGTYQLVEADSKT